MKFLSFLLLFVCVFLDSKAQNIDAGYGHSLVISNDSRHTLAGAEIKMDDRLLTV